MDDLEGHSGENRTDYFFEPLLPSVGLDPMLAAQPAPPTHWQRYRFWAVAIASSFFLGAGAKQIYSGHSARGVPNAVQSLAVIPLTAEQARDLPPLKEVSNPNPDDVPSPSNPTVAEVALTIKAVGDMIMGTDYRPYRMPDDWRYFFDSIQFHLQDADLVFGNFESTLTAVPHSAKDTSQPMTFAFRSPPWYASILKVVGFDVLNVANNHSMDFGEQGFNDTIAHIQAEGMVAVGRKGDIQYTTINGLTVGFIGFSYLGVHNTVHNLDTAAALVQQAKQSADIVVVSVHAGKEGTDAIHTRDQAEFFYSENRGNLVRFAHTVIDNGADLVLGHGPHVPRALELRNHKLIAYSLGNFLGYRTLSTQGPLGTSMILQIGLDAQGNFVRGRIIPVALDPNGMPYLDDYFGGVIWVRNLTRQDFPDTPLVIDDQGYIWPHYVP